MRSSYGTNFSLTLFGESHGPAVGFVLDGLPAGIELDLQNIRDALTRRPPGGKISTQRQEADEFRFLSGFYKGRTCGTPLTFVIENTAQRSEDYDEMQFLPRPSHADYAAFAKYGGYQDPRGGGHFSGRVTAGLVAAGAIFQQILSEHGVTLGTHVKSCQDIADRPFAWDRLGEDLASLLSPGFPVLDETARRRMLLAIEAAQSEGDSLGAVLETAVLGLPRASASRSSTPWRARSPTCSSRSPRSRAWPSAWASALPTARAASSTTASPPLRRAAP